MEIYGNIKNIRRTTSANALPWDVNYNFQCGNGQTQSHLAAVYSLVALKWVAKQETDSSKQSPELWIVSNSFINITRVIINIYIYIKLYLYMCIFIYVYNMLIMFLLEPKIYGVFRVVFRISGDTEGWKLTLGHGGLCSNGCRHGWRASLQYFLWK